MAGGEGGALQHGQAVGAVAGGAVVFAEATVADIAGGVRKLPAINEQSFTYTKCGSVR